MGYAATIKAGRRRQKKVIGAACPMRLQLVAYVAIIVAGLTFSIGIPAFGQASDGSAKPQSTQQSDPSQQPTAEPPKLPLAGPDTTIWIDDQGKPRPVLGISYEEFAKAWRAANGIDKEAALPPFTMDAITIEGTVGGSVEGAVIDARAELTVRYEFSLRGDQPVALPLGFAHAILNDGTQGLNTESEFLDYAEQRGGYVAWLMPSEETSQSKRSITLKLLLPLAFDGTQTLLQTNIPRATKSRFSLNTPKRISTPTINSGILTATDKGQGSALTVQGAVGAIELGWQNVVASQRRTESVLSAQGSLFLDIDGQSIRTTASLTVESFRGEFRRFRIQLPKAAQVLPTVEAESTATPFEISLLQSESETAGAVYTVERNLKSSEPMIVQFETQQPIVPDVPNSEAAGNTRNQQHATIPLEGFAVIGAVRQLGDVAIRTSDDWRLRLEDKLGAQRIDPGELSEELQEQNPTLALRYYNQPWQASVKVLPRETRIEATPRYRLEIGPNEAILRARVDYRIPGARAFGFRVAMGDFSELTLDPIGPVGIVDRDQVFQSEEGTLFVPMKQAVNRRVELEFVARCPLEVGSEKLQLRLPTPLDCVLEEAELVVVSDESVQLYPAGKQPSSLRPEPMSPEDITAADPSGLRTFRFRGYLPELTFEARKRILPQEIDVDSQSRFGIQDDQTSVEQTIDYEIRYQVAEQLKFRATKSLLKASDSLRFELLPLVGNAGDPVPLLWSQVDSAASDKVEESSTEITENNSNRSMESDSEIMVALPRPWIGAGRLRVRYVVDRGWPKEDSDELLTLPLLVPTDVSKLKQRVSLNREIPPALDMPTAEVELIGQVWIEDQELSGRQRLVATASRAADSLQLQYRPQQAAAPRALVLKRLWMQTWQRVQRRQQRLVFTLEGSGVAAQFTVPDEVSLGTLEILADGREVVPKKVGRGLIQISLSEGDLGTSLNEEVANRSHQIEIRYFENSPFVTGQLIASPSVVFKGDANWAECYWQVVTPSSQEPLSTPEGFSAVRRWRYGAGIWQPQAPMNSEDLENWAGAIRRSRPTVGERAVLLSSFAVPIEPVALRLIDRRLSVLVCSLLVFAVGLLLIYQPALRRLPLVLALATTLAGLAVAMPGLFITVSQASALGVVGIALALLLRVLFTRSDRMPDTIYMERASTQTSPAVPDAGADSFMAIPLDGVSSNAPTVSLPTAGPFASDSEGSQ